MIILMFLIQTPQACQQAIWLPEGMGNQRCMVKQHETGLSKLWQSQFLFCVQTLAGYGSACRTLGAQNAPLCACPGEGRNIGVVSGVSCEDELLWKKSHCGSNARDKLSKNQLSRWNAGITPKLWTWPLVKALLTQFGRQHAPVAEAKCGLMWIGCLRHWLQQIDRQKIVISEICNSLGW